MPLTVTKLETIFKIPMQNINNYPFSALQVLMASVT